MKATLAIGLILIGLITLLGVYPSIKSVIDGTDTSNFGTLLSAYVGNLWWIAIVLAMVAVGSAWWIIKGRG